MTLDRDVVHSGRGESPRRSNDRTPSSVLARAVALADLRTIRGAASPLGFIGRLRATRALKNAAFEFALDLPKDREQPLVVDRDAVGATVALLQTAWLRLHRIKLPASLGLRELTNERYWSEIQRRAQRPPARRTLFMVVLIVVLGGGTALALSMSSSEPPPPAFMAPVGDRTFLPLEREETWVEALTDWVVSLDRLTRGRFEGELPSRSDERTHDLELNRKAVLGEDLRVPLGDAVVDALGRMLDGAAAAARGGEGWAAREEVFAEAVRTTNRELAKRGYGYFFDSYAVRFDDGRAEAAFYTFRVVASQRFMAATTPVEALHLRRVDRLNIVQSLLGYTSKRMDVAVLLVDKLEGEIATRLGPALMPGREMSLHMDAEDEGKTTWLAVRKKAGQVVRESFYGALPGEQQALSELGELLARRSDLVDDWNMRLGDRVTLREFETLGVDSSYRDSFQATTSREARAVLDEIQQKLETDEQRRLFLRLVTRHARPVELHEVQHRIDYASGEDFVVPLELLTILQLTPGSEPAESDEVRRVAFELSAYTAEIARDPEWARVNLTLLCEHLYEGSGGAEAWSAVLILEGIAKNLSLPFDPILDPEGRRASADLETVAALHLKLLGQPGPALSKAATAIWEAWFGHPLVRLDRLPEAPQTSE